MAAPKKKPSTTRKTTTSTRPTAARKTTTARKKAPVKSTAKKSPAKRSSKNNAEMRSFQVAKTDEPFMSMKPTIQTLYWLILAGSVLLLGLWVMSIHQKVQQIYDEIDQNSLIQQELDMKELEMLRERAEQNND